MDGALVVPCAPGAAVTALRPPVGGNELLALLPLVDRSRLEGRMRPLDVAAGTMLFEMGSVLTDVYFPVSAVVSLSYPSETGSATTLALVGSEGMAGVDSVFGAARSAQRAVVSQGGRLVAIRARALACELDVSAAMRSVLLAYAHAYYTEASRSVLCVQRHSAEQRFCGLLLLLAQRAGSPQLRASQDQLGEMLGVRRETVTEVATRMRAGGCIDYRRGRIVLLNRLALRAHACDCHLPALARSAAAALRPERLAPPPARLALEGRGAGAWLRAGAAPA